MAQFYGIEGIAFNWHGQWADPTITYKGHEFNYWDVEDALYSNYKEDHSERPDLCHAEDDAFAAWLQANPQEAYDLLDDWIWAGESAA